MRRSSAGFPAAMMGGVALVAAVVALVAVLPAQQVQGQQSAAEARAEREAVRQERADAASELDAARADDAAVAAALRDITDLVNAQQARLDEASRQLEVNQGVAADAEAAVVEALATEAVLSEEIRQIAVLGFVNADNGNSTAAFLASSDFTEALRQNALLDHANQDAVELLEDLRIVQEDRAVAEALAAEAVEESAALESEMATILVGYDEQRQVQAELKAEMESRVAAWEATVAEFAAEEQSLSDFIRAEERRLNPPTPATPAAPRPGTPSVSGFQWPVGGSVTSGYGYRTHPIFGTRRLHRGLDISGSTGTPIAAANGGTVILAGWNGGYGKAVVISHGSGITSLYAHQSQIAVSVGDTVSRGDIIGYVGSTGQSTGPHLHFEIRSNGTAVDPRPYLP